MEEQKKQPAVQTPKKDNWLVALAKEFKIFISRGNVMDMAVGVIVGSAFTAIVNSLVNNIFTPLLSVIIGGIQFSRIGFTVPFGDEPFVAIGSFLQAVITFLLTALCVFLLVKAMNLLSRKKEETPKKPVPPSKEELLLTEIRDLLHAQVDQKQQK